MARGAEAKELVAARLKEAFGADYIGEFDKKHYIWAVENGERLQIAISMTCPKNPVGETSAFAAAQSNGPVEPATASVEISDEERKNVAELLKKLGL